MLSWMKWKWLCGQLSNGVVILKCLKSQFFCGSSVLVENYKVDFSAFVIFVLILRQLQATAKK